MDRATYFDQMGAITSIYEGLCIDRMDALLPGYSRVAGVFEHTTHYIDLTDPDNPTPTERPASPVTRTDLTLLDVPTGSTLYINGVSYPAEGTVELGFTYPGTYALRVECFPYLDWNDEVAIP